MHAQECSSLQMLIFKTPECFSDLSWITAKAIKAFTFIVLKKNTARDKCKDLSHETNNLGENFIAIWEKNFYDPQVTYKKWFVTQIQ